MAAEAEAEAEAVPEAAAVASAVAVAEKADSGTPSKTSSTALEDVQQRRGRPPPSGMQRSREAGSFARPRIV